LNSPVMGLNRSVLEYLYLAFWCGNNFKEGSKN
jgi:hypothetical protein